MIFVVFKKPGGGLGVRGVAKYLNVGDTLTDIAVVVPFLDHSLCRMSYNSPNGGEGDSFALPAVEATESIYESDFQGKIYRFKITSDMTSTSGTVRAQFIFSMDGGGQVPTESFSFQVNGIEPPVFPESEAECNNFGEVLQNIAAAYVRLLEASAPAQAIAAKEAATSAKKDAEDAKKDAEDALKEIQDAREAAVEAMSNFTRQLGGYYAAWFDRGGYIQSATQEVKDEIATAKEEAIQSVLNSEDRFAAGEFYEDENANIYSGDSKANSGNNGDDAVTGKCNALLNSGGGNTVPGDHNLLSGALNTVDAENCIVVGIHNKATLVEKTVNGVKHTYGHRAALFGRYLTSNANDQVWVGRWNKAHEGVLFGVGNGTVDGGLSNAFVVYAAGTAAVGHDPVGDMDVVTKRFLMEKVGDIESALDAIIAIQEQMIGGSAQ